MLLTAKLPSFFFHHFFQRSFESSGGSKVINNYVADGLAHNRIKRFVQDSHGFLWFCTADGLSGLIVIESGVSGITA
ncbi:MAG TPA: hypothetical protein VGJ48_01180 [Pyrinomonadaceae bacterium]|jgi:hypothetical protein